MTAKIGILGEDTAVVAATVTVYTVPANKAARVRVLFAIEAAGNNYDYNIYIGTPGNEITIHYEVGADVDGFSGSIQETVPDPALGLLMRANGMQLGAGLLELDVTFANMPWLIAPFAVDYYLSTGDTVRYKIGINAVTDHLIQVIGVEDDV